MIRPLNLCVFTYFGSNRVSEGLYTFKRHFTSEQKVFSSLNMIELSLSSSHSSMISQNAILLSLCPSFSKDYVAAVRHFKPFRLRSERMVWSETPYSRAKLMAVKNGSSLILRINSFSWAAVSALLWTSLALASTLPSLWYRAHQYFAAETFENNKRKCNWIRKITMI